MTPPAASPSAPLPLPCPICKQPVAALAPARPFCTARCKWVDLGRWLDGSYVLPSETAIDFEQVLEYEERKARGGDNDADG